MSSAANMGLVPKPATAYHRLTAKLLKAAMQQQLEGQSLNTVFH